MEAIKHCGEMYYPVEQLQLFIEDCNRNGIVIYNVEFYLFAGEQIIPNIDLMGIECIGLYDENRPHLENMKKCNAFVASCAEKSKEELRGKYFCADLIR